MPELWVAIICVIIGFILGIAGEEIRRWRKKGDQKKYTKKLLQLLCEEIGEGIKRCEYFVNLREKNEISFSRIYTDLWDSCKSRSLETIENLEVLHLLHHIHSRFDLINFNMEGKKFGVGSAFAKQYINEIKTNYSSLKSKMDTI